MSKLVRILIICSRLLECVAATTANTALRIPTKPTCSSSSIHLVSPLTKEMISMNNDGGQEYGGDGTIKSVDKDGKVLEVLYDGEEGLRRIQYRYL